MTHVKETLQAYLDGELAPGRRQEVERHLADCADCRRELTALRELWRQVDGLPPMPPSESILPDLQARLADRRRQAPWTWPQRGLAAAALAAGVVVGIGVASLPAPATDVATAESSDYLQDSLPTLDELWFELGTSDEDVES
jgi:anti-sigma factor RsiW